MFICVLITNCNLDIMNIAVQIFLKCKGNAVNIVKYSYCKYVSFAPTVNFYIYSTSLFFFNDYIFKSTLKNIVWILKWRIATEYRYRKVNMLYFFILCFIFWLLTQIKFRNLILFLDPSHIWKFDKSKPFCI